jgi:hypothetical protein
MEYWIIGILGTKGGKGYFLSSTPSFLHSIIPKFQLRRSLHFHHSSTPLLHFSKVFLCGHVHRIEDFIVTGTTTKVALQSFPDLFYGGPGILIQQCSG